MGLIERCNELFKTSSLYEVLGTSKQATEADIRRAYYKVSLKVHPDRAPDDELATEKFQVLGKVYAVLSDAEQKTVYDEQGIVDEETDALSHDRCWEDYWRVLFPQITVQDIVEFEKKYKGTDEERQDVLQFYVQYKGNMDAIMESTLCCSADDEPRICSIIQEAIDKKEVAAFHAFTKESEKKKKTRRKRADKERQEAEEMQKEMGLGDEDDSLTKMIKLRQTSRDKNFNSFLSNLEEKYAPKAGKSKKAKK
ncbi:dnaJ homolog subfamily C member 9 [Eucyclogobius newberryi]|uniref:dnaJ homolog subfamily C member 9 n=1 Tax=Eucyclogobius newberryi TaxID=166745 RepID=UPI003B5B1076